MSLVSEKWSSSRLHIIPWSRNVNRLIGTSELTRSNTGWSKWRSYGMAHSIELLTLGHKNGAGIKTTGPNQEFLVSFSF